MNFLTHLLPTFQHLGWWSYWLILLIAAAESIPFAGLVVPGSVLTVFFGFLASQGYFDIGDAIWFAAIGAILGDALGYWLGTKGTHLFKKENRWLKRSHLDRGKAYFKKHGGKSIFFGRFIGGLRPIIPFVAGLSDMPKGQFFLWNILSGFLWAAAHLLLGFYFGGALNSLQAWTTRVGVFLLAIFVIILLIRLLLRFSQPILRFLGSVLVSVKDGFLQNKEIRGFVQRHPGFFSFLKARFDTKSFFGLTLTLLVVSFIYLLGHFLGVAEDILRAETIVTADIRVENLLLVFRTPQLLNVFLWITVLGKWQTVAFSMAIVSMLYLIWNKRVYLIPLWISVAGSSLFMYILKVAFQRPRPAIASYIEKSYSFPSGHATIVVALYGYVAYSLIRSIKSWKVRINVFFLTSLVILLVGFSRLYLGVHFLSDVEGGYLLGGLWLIIAISLTEWLKAEKHFPFLLRGKRAHQPAFLSTILAIIYAGGLTSLIIWYNPPLLSPNVNPVRTIVSAPLDLFTKQNLPKYTETLTGKHQEPIMFVITAKDQASFIADMEQAGWKLADKPSLATSVHLLQSALLNQSDPRAPMTPSFWNTKTHDLGFEKQTAEQSARERHHARFWATGSQTTSGEQIFIGTASLDTGIKWFITHTIAPDIDTERETLVSDLKQAGVLQRSNKQSFVPPTLGQNFTGDPFFTDGNLYQLDLKPQG